ncbi:TPA: hypothetical protein ACOEGO_004353 [Enterobacter mori]|uniref:Uncharacterized protein n=1 Tax=Enterobacter quasimori TaxID=2838947 RepID=A0ABY0ALL2_9ENTR|nr:hypothetical protein [Enterobacter quasimori]RTN17121.1 hypothetical protein EKN94_22775 [Enterobacter quasimori]
MKKLLAACVLFISLNSFGGGNMDSVRYTAFFNTKNSNCILSVNGLDYLSTLKGSRTISTGSDITDALENSSENNIGLIFFPSEPEVESDEYYCNLKLVRSVPNGQDEVVTYFKTIFDGRGNRPYSDPNGYTIQDVNDNTGNAIIKGISNRIKFKGDEKPENWLTAYRKFTVSGIPEWKWTKASPQKNESALRGRLIESYKDLINDLKSNDLTTIKKKYSIALDEYAKTDFTDDTELFFNSIGIVNAVQKGKVNSNPNWDDFKVLTYQNNRMFCLGIGGASRMSPIQFFNADGKRIFSWNPFFAVIDNKIVLVR